MFHIHIPAKELSYGLNAVISVVDRKHPRPLLTNIKLESMDDCVVLTASNLNVTLQATLSAKVIEAGSTSVNAVILADTARKFHDTIFEIRFLAQTQSLTIEGDGFRSELSTMGVDGFPSMEPLFEPIGFEVACKDLLATFDQVEHTVPAQGLKYNVNGILLDCTDGVLYAVALDGHRMSIAGCKIAYDGAFKVVLPKAVIPELIKMCRQSVKDTIQISFDKVMLEACAGAFRLQATLGKANCPNYRNIIPSTSANCLIIPTTSLVKAIDRVSTLACDTNSAITISLSALEVKVAVYGSMKGSSYAIISEGFEYTGTEITFGVNPRYLMDVLGVYRGEMVELHIKSASSAILIKIPSHPLSAFVIMPVNLAKGAEAI